MINSEYIAIAGATAALLLWLSAEIYAKRRWLRILIGLPVFLGLMLTGDHAQYTLRLERAYYRNALNSLSSLAREGETNTFQEGLRIYNHTLENNGPHKAAEELHFFVHGKRLAPRETQKPEPAH